MGTPDFAVPTLAAIHGAGHEIAAVYTQPPRAAGRRGLALTPSPVQVRAEALGLDVRSPLNFKDPAERERFAALGADVAVVVAYGLLLPQPVLDAPRLGCFNLHGSLLPRWRGAAPIQRAIEAGDARTGVMVMRMEAGLDTGPVALTAETPIGESDTAGDLSQRLSAIGADLVVEALARLAAGDLPLESQDELTRRTGVAPTYARKIDKAEAALDLTGDAAVLARRINAFSPAPGAHLTVDLGNGPERLKVLRARAEEGRGDAVPGTLLDDGLRLACGRGALRLLDVQRAGSKAMGAAQFLAGTRLKVGASILPAAG
ncbi:methionyl-tRNA formyltransferase [Antarcticirhabdus aurantiaca]|uniref:Methionyl-tRNA formyltransferase n=1 Tax=Antarcticirhabdus aurantiaca TaxID=2606717 RepID=A0ACD4NXJ3_9HYPH|nr:methionyl-tRNA formyltransferase [Antarcticirhabdus aurantiaca]WAJ31530.1 methionyl-tRNA formyltransferase [Jeongeuplla avenae]